MALFSKKDKYIRINPNRSSWKDPQQNQKYQMSFSRNVQDVNIPFTKRTWEASEYALIVAIASVFQLKNDWLLQLIQLALKKCSRELKQQIP